ncbi:kinase-like domain-containing protein [Lactifluus volemus]|nr:kinase-like domain-containing protein [Lactifluus volemus]
MQPTTTKCSQKDAPQSLLDLTINKGGFKEREARPLAQQLARTVSLLHKHGVVHRKSMTTQRKIVVRNSPPPDLKLDNILVSTGTRTTIGTPTPTPTPATFTIGSSRLILTDFTYAAVSVAPVSRCGDQYSPAPELLLSRKSPAEEEEKEGWVPSRYAGPPVDVWGLGVVLFTLVCHRVPFDGPTMDVLGEASRHSPSCLTFPRRISRAARASLEEVLNHPWIAEGNTPMAATYAALKWPDEVNHERFHVCAALDSADGDSEEAWRYLTETLALVSCLCETPDNAFDAARQIQTCSSAAWKHCPSSPLLFRGIRALADNRKAWLLFDKLRSIVSATDWTRPFQASRRKRRSNVAIFR